MIWEESTSYSQTSIYPTLRPCDIRIGRDLESESRSSKIASRKDGFPDNGKLVNSLLAQLLCVT
jgi:hypothetical protein